MRKLRGVLCIVVGLLPLAIVLSAYLWTAQMFAIGLAPGYKERIIAFGILLIVLGLASVGWGIHLLVRPARQRRNST
ncbi:hypothetical protein [Nitrospirillum viridazoti]|uniref:Uncharacterized protein n=1 Tax=Nitrospirillum viridazoti CBAmc TaxID=1441467 RepID=A0A248JZT7_9PROT|nr:hypothetical protein [Nitrospirillum amazonense]ASG23694.1 hypothetical protein Y958_22130 [Nitrospirillum amazonense CBAmc]TWB44919.1 hypothetical protein FBZ91_101390 [Nitrospirillum amazonense]